MEINIVIDGNYILMKNIFALKKMNELYGNLEVSLHASLKKFMVLYPFANVFLVSDSGTSWRKNIYPEYKANRTKSDEIDWDFVFQAYTNFKADLPKRVTLYECPNIEGDDWISHLIRTNPTTSTLIISNDHDLKQLINFNNINKSMVFMSNEMYSNTKVFMPQNYHLFLSHIRDTISDNIFEVNDEDEYIRFILDFIKIRNIDIVNPIESFITKLIKGDKSDNIKSVFITKSKNGKDRGIGDAGAQKIYNNYVSEFGEPKLNDNQLFEKKIQST